MTDPQNPYRPTNNDAHVPPVASQPGAQQPFNYATAPEHAAQGQQAQGQQAQSQQAQGQQAQSQYAQGQQAQGQHGQQAQGQHAQGQHAQGQHAQGQQGQQTPGQQWAPQVAPAGPKRPSIWAAFGPGRNVFGVVSLGAVVAALVISSILQLVTAALVVGDGYAVVGLVNGVSTAIAIVLTLIALVFGTLGLLSSNPSKWPAIAGTAVGVFVLVSTLIGFAVSTIYTLL